MTNQDNNLENNSEMLENEQNVSEQDSMQGAEAQDMAEDTEVPIENHSEEAATDELEEWKNKYLRLVADFDNYKKRTNRERLEIIQTAGKDVITSMLDVLDDMNRAEAQLESEEDINQLKEGVKLVFNKMRKTLQDQGLQPFDSVGEDFDVELHDAITEIPAPSEDMKSKVVDEVQKGYYLNDKLLRHAKVVVGK